MSNSDWKNYESLTSPNLFFKSSSLINRQSFIYNDEKN